MRKGVNGFADLSPEDRERLELSGIMLSSENRCGSFFQEDQDVRQTSCTYEGIEMLPTAEALKKYDWMQEYYWNLVDKDKDEYTRYVADHEPRGYVWHPVWA